MLIHLLIGTMYLMHGHPHDCDPDLISAIEWVESRGNPLATSPKGAVGVMQVIPKWSKWPIWTLRIPAISRMEGCRIFKRWLRRAGGVPTLALQAYNGGNVGLRDECSRCTYYAHTVLEKMDEIEVDPLWL